MYTLANITVAHRGRFCWWGYIYIYIRSAVYIAIGVELDPVKSKRYGDPLAVNNNNHSGYG